MWVREKGKLRWKKKEKKKSGRCEIERENKKMGDGGGWDKEGNKDEKKKEKKKSERYVWVCGKFEIRKNRKITWKKYKKCRMA